MVKYRYISCDKLTKYYNKLILHERDVHTINYILIANAFIITYIYIPTCI